jgi:hypothetical protein
MRRGALVFATCLIVLPVVASAQVTNSYLGRNYTPPDTVIRPAAMDGWRNYVTVPDGPCGYPMAVQADCYTGCGGGCGCCGGPLVFLHRCKLAILSCLLPCNMCCRGGCGGGGCGGCDGCGGGPAHGCLLGGRTWGHCGVCCGGPIGGGRMGGGPMGGGCGCCPNPCGSAFSPAYGGHCSGCGGGMRPGGIPAGGDVMTEDALPAPIPTPQPSASPATKPTSMQAPEVRRRQPSRTQPAHFQLPENTTSRTRSNSAPSVSPASANSPSSQSVLRKASAEQLAEPSPLFIDLPAAKPIVRSQSPESVADASIPQNPLRR